MTTEEQKLCNGITFSVSKLVPNLVQEGEQEGASHYAHVLLTPKKDSLVIKIWRAAPFNSLLQLEGEDVDSFIVDVTPLRKAGEEGESCGYNFGGQSGVYAVWRGPKFEHHNFFPFRSYSGLMIYPAVKCIVVDIIKDVDRINKIHK